MIRLVAGLIPICFAVFAFADSDTNLRNKPITTDTSEVGNLLRKWYKEGTAAGNVDDWYDNRDGDHSPLNLSPYPQLQKVPYSAEDLKTRRNWALQTRVLEKVVFGNSSTSAAAHTIGSNPRSGYTGQLALSVMAKQYLGNNLYIYPEHRDHDPGHNGVNDGYGDLYPTNTPYLLTSQGSSGSDQPFMRAIPFTLAAFRPEVKKKLIETGLLMPTVQMIFRMSNKNLKQPDDYFTGKAHPSVFEGSDVDVLKMVKLAHDIRLDSIPPLVKLKVIEETQPKFGSDYFEPAPLNEKLGDTVSVIARIWRGRQYTRRMVVSAADSLDVNKKPLTFRWVVLRGDDQRIQITSRNKVNSEVEITVTYHERRPISPGSSMESNRVDIGVFATNGVHQSAPGFVTYFSLDSESRHYDADGRIIEIGYSAGDTEVKIADWPKFLQAMSKEGIHADVLDLNEKQRESLTVVAKMLENTGSLLEATRKRRQEKEKERAKTYQDERTTSQQLASLRMQKKSMDEITAAERKAKIARDARMAKDTEIKMIDTRIKVLETAIANLLDSKRNGFTAGVRPYFLTTIHRLINTPNLWEKYSSKFQPIYDSKENTNLRGRINTIRGKLIQLGMASLDKDQSFKLRPLIAGKKEHVLTAYEKGMVKAANARLLSEIVLSGLPTVNFRLNYVDFRLTTNKPWRDVYHHKDDTLFGWKRYHLGVGNRISEFTPEGWRITKKDDKGRPIEAHTVVYRFGKLTPGRINTSPIEQQDGDERIVFKYEDNKRVIQKREKRTEIK